MIHSHEFFRSVLDSVAEQIVVIDGTGSILFVNEAWSRFGVENNCKIQPEQWRTWNYLKVCDDSGKRGEHLGGNAAVGIRKVIDGSVDVFNIDYPCHSPRKKRWFTMSVTPLKTGSEAYYAISHKNITERKAAEEHVLNLSRIDGLTKVPNRRFFDQFLADEWKRCKRLGSAISLALLDIDHFKLLNDTYGHPYGDACLVQIGEVLNRMTKRPTDMFARYGGEEFALIFGNSTTDQALVPVTKLLNEIASLSIPNEKAPTKPTVSVSVGLVTMFPGDENTEQELISAADGNLYKAKHAGRNRIISSEDLFDRQAA